MWRGPIERIRSSPTQTALAAMVLAIAYVLLGRLTFSVSVEYSNITSVVFAPEGVALAFAIIFGPRVAWGVLVGQTVLSLWSGPSVFGGVTIGIINALECALGAILFARWKISPQFAKPRDVLLFVVLVFLVLQPISATGGVSVLWAIGATPTEWIPQGWETFWTHGVQQPLEDAGAIPSAWVHWWIGNSVGQMLIAPLLLAWSIKGVARHPKNSYDLIVSAAAIGLLGLAATVLPVYPLLVLGVTYPLLVWIGLRRGLRGVTTANVLIAPAITWAGAVGTGFLSHLSVPDRLAHVGFFIATGSIFSLMLFAMFEERRILVERLDDLARLDSLVPLANRRHFVESLQSHLGQTSGADGPVAVVAFDVDHFKRINDRHGHIAGDSVLLAIADTCTTRLDDGQFAARIGGEEFAIALPDTDLATARQFADELRDAIEHQHLRPDAPTSLMPVTVSVGVTVARQEDSLDTILLRVDEALYDAKRAGRNTIVTSE
ncbi:diguanylate cyclase [Mycolicibacterium hippocampi]|uniref:GGDEF domain protein n=1 Tax=Mycolicibacterium hippocampi TaxID=659824 RepID=A0A850PJZ0_9MYCO|nr:diguanylate cyclase [Mycolicibacterium hippocampi]NVN50639.1 GGDEF domain protein [Mycolicibacterium hippocampi]